MNALKVDWWWRLLQRRTVLVLALLAVAGGMVVLWHMSRVSQGLVETATLQDAALYSQAIAEFRTLYTSEVVATARGHGLKVSHNYYEEDGAIPLPATLSMLLGEKIGESQSGAETRLYSPYPFPWRKQTGGLRDSFAQAAWAHFLAEPDVPFYRFESLQGRPVVRYATADRMRQACVNCHNTHADSPKTDWNEGDVRGVLEVVLPLDRVQAKTRAGLRGTLFLIAGILTAGITVLWIVIGRLKRTTTDLADLNQSLEQRVAERTGELQQANAALERSNQELDDFAHIASHDLKEPLRGIHTYSTLMLEDYADKLDADGQSKLNTLQRLTRRMESLIQSLLSYSRVGRTEMAVQQTDLNELLAEILDSLHVGLEQRGVVVRIPRPLPTVHCDRVRVGEVFRNLITNAAKYNDKPEKWMEIGFRSGPPEVALPAGDGTSANGSGTVFHVRDNGIGIREKHLSSIFRIFKRLHGRDEFGGGTGVGLTIAKKIVERHGGRIWIESTFGEGTTFFFTLEGG